MRRLGPLIFWAALLMTVLATGCGQGSESGQGTPSTAPEEPTQRETTLEDETVRTTPPAGEAGVAPFTAAPEMSGGSEGAAQSIREVRFGGREGLERAVIGFGSGGAPASRVPAWSLSSPTGEGYARITLPDLDSTSVPNGDLGGSTMDNFYVVRAPGGGMFVDIFATGAFQYRVTELSDPARLLVDYRPASVPLDFPIPAQTAKTVLFEPREGEAVSSPLRINGYSRNPEASNTVSLVDSNGNVLFRRTVLSNDWTETWGYFEISLELPAFEGPATLRAGGQSARDGSFEGVEVPVTYGGGQG